MEIIKRKISIEDYIIREPNINTWGTYIWDIESERDKFPTSIDSSGNTKTPSLVLNVFIKQNMDDMGIGTNLGFIENLTATSSRSASTLLSAELFDEYSSNSV